MKKSKVTKLRVRWRARKVVAVFMFILVCGLIVGLAFCFAFAQYTRLETWIMSWIIGIGGVVCMSACIYLFIGLRSKKEVYYIDLEQKICTKKNKKIYYKTTDPKATYLQKKFGLVSIEFRNNTESIVLKDVNKEVLKYL